MVDSVDLTARCRDFFQELTPVACTRPIVQLFKQLSSKNCNNRFLCPFYADLLRESFYTRHNNINFGLSAN